ncbi:MAG: DUF3302 domain-containing protein [Candidatus Berkiellales bacterium]
MLDYIALCLLIFVVLVLFYGIIALHDIPYEIAKSRQHPHQDAIHISGWVSLFTLHVIWPFLWIWATLYRPDRGWGFVSQSEEKAMMSKLEGLIEQQRNKIEKIETESTAKTTSLLAEMNKVKIELAVITAKVNKETP